MQIWKSLQHVLVGSFCPFCLRNGLLCKVLDQSKSPREVSYAAQVFPSIPACVDLIEGPYIETNEAVVKAFRPSQLQKKS